MIPKNYKHCVTLRSLQDEKYTFIDLSQDIESTLDFVGFPKRYRKDITGAVIYVWEGDYIAVWLSESNRPYDLSASYYALPGYRPRGWTKRNLPEYWLESNQEYCQE